jgi:hypothetical protein
MQELIWYRILDNVDGQLLRAQVFGGWLVRHKNGSGLTFVADPELRWEVATRPAVIPEPPRVVAPVTSGD